MGIVQSFINQIGREFGRDVYRGMRGRQAHNRDYITLPFNEAFLHQIREFQLDSNDKSTVRNLINLVMQSEKIDPRTFNWLDCYDELDHKIDFCKEHLDAEHRSKLEELDKQNAVNFSIAKAQHTAFIRDEIKRLETDNAANTKIFIFPEVLLSLVGLNAFFYPFRMSRLFWNLLGTFSAGVFFYYSYTTFFVMPLDDHLTSLSSEEELKMRNYLGIAGIVLGLLCYLPVIRGAFKRLQGKLKNRHTQGEILRLYTDHLQRLNASSSVQVQ